MTSESMTEFENLICTFSVSERPFKFSVTLPPAACPDCRLQILFTRKRRLKSPRYVSKTELCAQIVELAVFIKTAPHCERKNSELVKIRRSYCLEEAVHRNLVEVFWCCWGINKSLWTGWMRLHQRGGL